MKTINFNPKIYKISCIKKAIKDYSHLAKFDLKQTKKYIKVIISDIEPEFKDKIADEFCNYVLYLVKSKVI
jgi:hypothetical protein